MSDTIFQLPQDIFPGMDTVKEDIIIHNYLARMGSRGKSMLTKNAISMVISGRKTMHFAEQTVHVNEDEFHFLSAGNCLVYMDIVPDKPFHSVLIFFSDSVLASFYMKYAEEIGLAKERLHPKPQPYVAVRKDDFTRNFIQSLLLVLDKPMTAGMKALKLEELLLYLLERHPHALLAFQHQKNQGFDEIEFRRIIEVNLANNLALEELAFLCRMSLSTFKRRFAAIYGESPSRWMLRRRMEMAAGLLQGRGEKPGEVYYKVGYENHSSFSQSFKQAYGMTPSEYQTRKMTA